jgi:hypothetical protein
LLLLLLLQLLLWLLLLVRLLLLWLQLPHRMLQLHLKLLLHCSLLLISGCCRL